MKHYQKYSTVVLVKKGNFNYEISIQCKAFIKQKIMVK